MDRKRTEMSDIQSEGLKVLIEFDRICRKNNIKYSLSDGTLLGAVRHDGFIPWDDDIDVSMTRESFNVFESVIADELSDEFFYQTNETDPDYYAPHPKIRSNNAYLKEKCNQNINIHEGVWIDIFVFDRIPTNLEEADAIQNEISNLSKKIVRMVNIYPDGIGSKLNQFVKSVLFYFNKFFYKINSLPKKYFKQREALILKNKDIEEFDSYALLAYNSSFDEYRRLIRTKDSFENTIEHSFEGYDFLISEKYDDILTNEYGDYMTLPKEEDRVSNHQVVSFTKE